MKQRKETKVDAVFNVESLISILRGLKMQEHKPESSIYGDNGVCYDFWQLLYVENGTYTCQIEGCSPSPICRGQLLICEPKKIRFSWQVTDTVVSFINIRCTAPQLRQMKNRCRKAWRISSARRRYLAASAASPSASAALLTSVVV